MAQRYIDELAKWVEHRQSTPRDKYLVAFLAVKADVNEAIEAGYAVRTIWANMQHKGRITYGYDTFRDHVNRMLRKEARVNHKVSESASVISAGVQIPAAQEGAHGSWTKAAPVKTVPAKSGVPSFTFRPEANKEDLI